MTLANLTRSIFFAVGGLVVLAGGAAADEPGTAEGVIGGAGGVVDAGARDTNDVPAVNPEPAVNPVVEPVVNPVRETGRTVVAAVHPVAPAAPVASVTPVAKVAPVAKLVPVAKVAPPARDIVRTVPAAVPPVALPVREAKPAVPARVHDVPPVTRAPAIPIASLAEWVRPVVVAVAAVPSILEIVGAVGPARVVADAVGEHAEEITPIVEPVGHPVAEVIRPAEEVASPLTRPSIRSPLDAVTRRSADVADVADLPALVPPVASVPPVATQTEHPLLAGPGSGLATAWLVRQPARWMERAGSAVARDGTRSTASEPRPVRERPSDPTLPTLPGTPPGGATPLFDPGLPMALLSGLLALLAVTRSALRTLSSARPLSLTLTPFVPPA